MPGRIVADPRTLAGHAGDLSTLSGEFEREAYRLREALGFVINRPDIPNGAALVASYTTALQALDTASASSRQLSTSITRYAQRVVDCERAFLGSGGEAVISGRAGHSGCGPGHVSCGPDEAAVRVE